MRRENVEAEEDTAQQPVPKRKPGKVFALQKVGCVGIQSEVAPQLARGSPGLQLVLLVEGLHAQRGLRQPPHPRV